MSLSLSPHPFTADNDTRPDCRGGLASRKDAWLGGVQPARVKANPKLWPVEERTPLPMGSQGKRGDTRLYLAFQKQVPAWGLQAADSLPASAVGRMGLVREEGTAGTPGARRLGRA